jgi:hypothetical protein
LRRQISHAVVAEGTVTAAPFVAQSGTYTRYFAEGATGALFDTSLALLNPTAGAAVATLRFETPDGTHVERTLSIAARSRATIDPKDEPALAAAEFSTSVTSTQPLVIDRTMSWGAGGYGAHAEASIPAPASTWYLAEGATGAFNLFYLLQNPHGTSAQVRVRYLRPSGRRSRSRNPAAGLTHQHLGQPGDSALGPALAQGDVSAVIEVTSGPPSSSSARCMPTCPGSSSAPATKARASRPRPSSGSSPRAPRAATSTCSS